MMCVSCGNKAEEEKIQKANLKETIASMNEQNYREYAVLLSIKYELDEEKIFNLLKEEDNEFYDSLLDSDKSKKIPETLIRPISRNKIKAYSQKYGISPKVIASMFIDYKSMRSKD